MKIINFCKSIKGKIIMVGAVVIIAYVINIGPVSEKRDNVKGKVKQSVCEPLETVYHGAMSNISSSKDKPEEIEDSKETEKKDLKPKSTEKPKANLPKQKPDNKSRNKKSNKKQDRQWYNKQIIFRNPPVKPYVPPIGLYTAKPSSIAPNPKTQSAPYGQLLRCELTQTCMTSNLKTPIIAMVTEPL